MPDPTAVPVRVSREVLEEEVTAITDSPLIDGLMSVTGGLVAVLNEQRQILALNEGMLRMLGVEDPWEILGLRPGEAIGCVHADDVAAGCGGGPVCTSCGAAIAIVVSLHEGRPIERICAAVVRRYGADEDLFFKVRATPIHLDGRRHVLLFLQECSREQKRAVLERTFYHDITTVVQGLFGTAELLRESVQVDSQDAAQKVYDLSARLAQEISIQKRLAAMDATDYTPMIRAVTVAEVFEDLGRMFANHPAAEGLTLTIAPVASTALVVTDYSLLLRSMCNLVINALEASGSGGEVRVWHEPQGEVIELNVWNAGAMSPDIAGRIFQRNFSTKAMMGRGVGTYSVKLFIEEYVGGTVAFTTSEAEGTCFSIRLPAATQEHVK